MTIRFLIALILASTVTMRAENLSIAAAADLTYCIRDLDDAFQKNHPDAALQVSLGSSGNFFAQIKNGAPFQVFLSADISYPGQLIDAGLADKSTLTRYAQGRIVLWTMNDTLDLSHGLDALRDPAVKHIAIANPDHAPYGRAAKAALVRAKLWDTVTPRLVTGENISQAAQFVQSGNAEAGIVALSIVKSPSLAKTGHWWLIPAEDHPPLDQAAVITKAGTGSALARAYIAFLRSGEARKIFERFGFQLPATQ